MKLVFTENDWAFVEKNYQVVENVGQKISRPQLAVGSRVLDAVFLGGADEGSAAHK